MWQPKENEFADMPATTRPAAFLGVLFIFFVTRVKSLAALFNFFIILFSF